MFLAFLIKNKTLIIMAVLGLIISGQTAYIALVKSQKATLVAEKATLSNLLTGSQANLTQLNNDIEFQNKSIAALKTAADDRVKKNEIEVKQAKAVAETYKQQATTLLARVIPPGVDKCTASDLLINEEIKNAHK